MADGEQLERISDSWLSDALHTLSAQARLAADPKVVRDRALGDDAALIQFPGDDPRGYTRPPESMRADVGGLGDLIVAVQEWGGERSEVWVAPYKIVAVLGRGDSRRERVELPLMTTMAMLALQGMGPTLTQRQLISALRHELAGCGLEGLLAAVRRISWRRTSDGGATIAHGKESLGRKVEQEVQGTTELPEEITASLRVYSTRGCDYVGSVPLAITVDYESEKIGLRPIGDALQAAEDAAQASIANMLSGELGDAAVVLCGAIPEVEG